MNTTLTLNRVYKGVFSFALRTILDKEKENDGMQWIKERGYIWTEPSYNHFFLYTYKVIDYEKT